MFSISLSFWNQRVVQWNQSRHKCHSIEKLKRNSEMHYAPVLFEMCLCLGSRKEQRVSVLMFASWWGSRLMQCVLNLSGSSFYLKKHVCTSFGKKLCFAFRGEPDPNMSYMMSQTEWLEGRREPCWCFIIRLSNVLSVRVCTVPSGWILRYYEDG